VVCSAGSAFAADPPADPALADEWREVANQGGVRVYARTEPGRTMPLLRAETTIAASPYELMAVIKDVSGHSEWIHMCAEARLLQRESETVSYVYTRIDVPWPISDRDAVLRSELEVIEPGVELLASFRIAAPVERDVAARPGIWRMERLRGHYRLRATGDGQTHVEYAMDMDPGGFVPAWMVARGARDMPLKTLANLRERVRETRGQYQEWLRRWDPKYRTSR
jgi:hypothetical protein